MSIHYTLSLVYRPVNSSKAVNLVLVKVNRCAGLKVVKTKKKLGTAN
jgi:hypothetical protein